MAIVDEQADSGAAGADWRFEREKWLRDCEFRERDFALRTREVVVTEGDLAIRRAEQERGVFSSPLVLALLAATVAGLGNVFVAFHNGGEQRALEQMQAEHARIVAAINGDLTTASDKIRFLLDTHLIADPVTRTYISAYIDTRQVTNPSVAADAPPPSPNSAVKRVEVASGWLSGGHSQAEQCGRLVSDVKAHYPGIAVKLVGSSEDNHKDFLGHVTYNYRCQFDVG